MMPVFVGLSADCCRKRYAVMCIKDGKKLYATSIETSSVSIDKCPKPFRKGSAALVYDKYDDALEAGRKVAAMMYPSCTTILACSDGTQEILMKKQF